MINISEILNKPNAILHTDGNKLYDAIIESIPGSKEITLSFEGISHCTTSFLNASLGKLWMNKPELKDFFTFHEASPSLIEKIEMVKDHALNQNKRENWESAAREYLENA
ncbi:MAG: STAS-like domain-containing protein [Candidatus Paceibacterota bacterium]